MPNIIKSSTGLMFSEEFNGKISLLWDLSPNEDNRVANNSNSISLLHGDEKIKMLIPVPSENNFVIQSSFEYSPTSQYNKAGLTMESVTDTRVDFEICGDDDIKASYAKLCIDDYNILSAYASNDGNKWINYGNTKINNMNLVGFYNDSRDDDFKIYNFIAYKSNFITINGFDRHTYLRIFDNYGQEITGDFYIRKYNTRIAIDCINKIMPLNTMIIKIYNSSDDELLSTHTLVDVYGGDIYEFNYALEFKINDTILERESLFDLGSISGDTVFTVTVTNKENFDILGKTIKVSYYSTLNKSYKFVKISQENENVYSDSLDIDFPAGSNTKFKLKINKNAIYSEIDQDCKFSIIIE